jgi:hypothetical protein
MELQLQPTVEINLQSGIIRFTRWLLHACTADGMVRPRRAVFQIAPTLPYRTTPADALPHAMSWYAARRACSNRKPSSVPTLMQTPPRRHTSQRQSKTVVTGRHWAVTRLRQPKLISAADRR